MSTDDTPQTRPEESDPNADGPEGLAGDMGVSSERRGTVRGGDEEVTYTAAPTHDDEEPDAGPDALDPPERHTGDDGDVRPDPVESHPRNPRGNPGHLGG